MENTELDSLIEPYGTLAGQLETLLSDEENLITGLANASALLYGALADVNWAGFYLRQGERLVLGPFQGKPACTRIPLGKGVCGYGDDILMAMLEEDWKRAKERERQHKLSAGRFVGGER